MTRNPRYNFFIFLFTLVMLNGCAVDVNTNAVEWRTLAIRLIKKAESYDSENIHYLSYMAYSYGLIYDWQHPSARGYLQRAIDSAKKNGYGLGYAWDAFQDGTINPDSTDYTITLTDHVGLAYVSAYKSGVLPKEYLIDILERVLTMPMADSLNNGICISYSDSPFDQIGCVHNVNISVAQFLNSLVEFDEFEMFELTQKIDKILTRENSSYLINEKNYYYWDGNKRLTDQNHLAFQAWCMSVINNPESNKIGSEIINNLVGSREKSISAVIGHLRILPFNSANADSLKFELNELLAQRDTTYIISKSYNLESSRTLAQLALWSSAYSNYLSD